MITTKPDERLPRGRCGPDPASTDARPALAAGQLQELWAAYLADRGNLELRNRLIEHYLPWVGELAASLARKMRLRDGENAVGEVLAALVDTIVPGYDGKRGFHRWAYAWTKGKLLHLRRAERRHDSLFADLPSAAKRTVLDNAPDGGHPATDLTFAKITAELNDRQAVVLWLRGYCGLSVKAVSRLLKLSPSSVKARTRSAVAALKK